MITAVQTKDTINENDANLKSTVALNLERNKIIEA